MVYNAAGSQGLWLVAQTWRVQAVCSVAVSGAREVPSKCLVVGQAHWLPFIGHEVVSYMTCTLHQILLRVQVKETKMGGARSTRGRGEECM
jgi:hypothetical protein